jgi:hypothetical protein
MQIQTNRFYVYEHLRSDNGAIFYVGKGTGKRCTIRSHYHRNEFWQRTERKAGGFFVRIVVDKIDEDFAFLVEMERIDQLRRIGTRLCNLTDGGEGSSGCERTPEWREKIGAAHRGKQIPEKTRIKISESVRASGFVHTEEMRKKISATHKNKKRSLGYKHTDEWKSAQRERATGNKSRLGQTRSKEEREKASAALSGRIQTKIECPHCGKIGGNAMRLWHFENCKEKS